MSNVAVIEVLVDALQQALVVLPHASPDDDRLVDVASHLEHAVMVLQRAAAERVDDAVWCDIECWATEALFEVERLRGG